LTVEIRQGEADIEQVMKDVMSLTKLNFNAADTATACPWRYASPMGWGDFDGGAITSHVPLPFKF
jgi:hypothetical protein